MYKSCRDSWEAIGRTSTPSKMPGQIAWGIPVHPTPGIEGSGCTTGLQLMPNDQTVCSICRVDGRGFYAFGGAVKAQTRRLLALAHSRTFTDDFADVLQTMYERRGQDVFRWLDTGDLTPRLLATILEIVRITPFAIKHWIPTKEYALVRPYGQQNALPDNVTIRVSAPLWDHPAPSIGLPTSTVHNLKPAIGFECPAPTQGNKCLDCRACWEYPGNISYKAAYAKSARS